MTGPRLIFVEGMIGAGKSTTAVWLAKALAERGEAARAYHELAPDHPIRTKAVDSMLANHPQAKQTRTDVGEDGLARDTSVYGLEQWGVLAERAARGGEALIVESTLLQNAVQPLFAFGAPAGKVVEVFGRIAGRLRAVDCLLVYLRPTDVSAAIARVHEERGEPWSSWNLTSFASYPWARERRLSGRAALVAFYRAWDDLMDEALPAFPGPVLRLDDPQQDWAAARAAIMAAARPKR